MNRKKSSAIKDAIVAIIAAILGAMAGALVTGQQTRQHDVETLSKYFDSVDSDMQYEAALDSVYQEYKKLQETNEILETKADKADSIDEIQEAINVANQYAESKNYEEALSTLKELSNKTPQVNLWIDEYTGQYETQISNKADSLVKDGDYDAATELIDNALDVLPDSEALTQKKKSILASKPQYFLNIFPPYETSSYDEYVDGETFAMAGNKCTNGFVLGAGGGGFILSNLTGRECNKISFDVGHVDESGMGNATLSVYLDGSLYKMYDINAEQLPQKIEVPISKKKQIKLVVQGDWTDIGFADVMVS